METKSNGYCNGYLGHVLAAHDDENTDFLMSMMADVGDRMSVLKHQVKDMVSITYGKFHRVPREARRMKASLKVITERVEALDAKIKTKAVPNLKNSIGLMTALSKRIAEIVLMGKIVDELVKLNNQFVGAQDYQKEKKYFAAVKSLDDLHVNLENADNDVKQLKVYQALVNETSRSRAYLEGLLTTTLFECFKYQVTTGIDVSKISYYTLKVDKNRKEDFEESFQALHYLKKLDSFCVEFAEWLKTNIMLPIILHCCSVMVDNEDGKYAVLKVEADFTLPKCDFMKVFENLTTALTFLETYLKVTVDGNSTMMNELGKLTSKDFCSSLISHCLADTIPSHSNHLEEYKAVISATEHFHDNLKSLGFLDGSNLNLIDYTTNAEKLCATKTTKVLLVRAREIILKDLYDVMEMEIVPIVTVKPVKKKVQYEEDVANEIKTNSEIMLCPMKEESGQFATPLKVVPEQLGSPLNEDFDWRQSPANVYSERKQKQSSDEVGTTHNRSQFKENSNQKLSPVKQDSQQMQSPIKDDCQNMQTPIKEGHQSPVGEGNREIQTPIKEGHQSPVEEDNRGILSPIMEETNQLLSPVKEDSEMMQSPVKEDSQQTQSLAKENSKQTQSPFKQDSQQKQSPIKEGAEQLQSALKKDYQQLQSPAKEDSQQTESLVKEDVNEDSQHMQSPGTGDCESEVKCILASKSSVIADGSELQRGSSTEENLDTSLKDDSDGLERPEVMDSLHKRSPVHRGLEKTSDLTNDNALILDVGSLASEEPSTLCENETNPTEIANAVENTTSTGSVNDHDCSQDPTAPLLNVSQLGCAMKEPTQSSPGEHGKSLDESNDDTVYDVDEEIILEMSPQGSKFLLDPCKNESNFNLSGAIFAFPKCLISKSAHELMSLLNEVLNDCIGTSNECARNLFKTARKVVELYCAIAPIYHRKYLETIPQQAALFHNNCLYIAHCLLTLGHGQRVLLPEGTKSIGSFCDQVTVVRTLGASVFLAHMHFQRNQILDIIRNCGLSTLRECTTLTLDTERALRQCLRQLELLKSVWQPVLPMNVYINSMACLMNSFLDDLINRVMTVQDIPAETASQLVKMFEVVITRINTIFPDPNIVEEFANWEMFQELVLILGANMKYIKDRWANGHGPLALHFTPEQLRQLIRALFQNTERRSAILADIH